MSGENLSEDMESWILLVIGHEQVLGQVVVVDVGGIHSLEVARCLSEHL